MTTIAEFAIPAEEFALRETLERLPDIEIEVDRVVAHETTHVLPFVCSTSHTKRSLSAFAERHGASSRTPYWLRKTTVYDIDEPWSVRPNGLVESYWKRLIPLELDGGTHVPRLRSIDTTTLHHFTERGHHTLISLLCRIARQW